MEQSAKTPPPPLGLLIQDVARLMRRRFDTLAREHGMTLPQWRALSQIWRSGEISQVNLAGLIDSDPMTVSGILDRLEGRDLIQRLPDPSDSRAKLVSLTPAGEKLVDQAKTVGREFYEAALHGVSEQDRETITRALSCIRDNLSNPTIAEKEDAK